MSEAAVKPLIGVVGAGPGGLATALAFHRLGFSVELYERAAEIRPAGNILNLWPPPQEILSLLGVDVRDLGAPCHTTVRRFDGHLRAKFVLPDDVVARYNGGFIGLLRWGLYKRMIDALPGGILKLSREVTSFVDTGREVVVKFADGAERRVGLLVGADGIWSRVRSRLWGDVPVRHQRIHLVAGHLNAEGPVRTQAVFALDRTRQGSFAPILHEGKPGFEWWMLEAFEPGTTFDAPLREYALDRVAHFAGPLPTLIRDTPEAHCFRWEILDRPPMKQWSKGRVTLIGDACHPTSPYAAYGAGMSIEDGYFLAAALAHVAIDDTAAVQSALQRWEDVRKPHTKRITEEARMLGKLFHHTPRPLRPVRDIILDHTPFMQKLSGDATPAHILKQLAEIEATERSIARMVAGQRAAV